MGCFTGLKQQRKYCRLKFGGIDFWLWGIRTQCCCNQFSLSAWKEEEWVWILIMDNQTDGRTAERSPDARPYAGEIRVERRERTQRHSGFKRDGWTDWLKGSWNVICCRTHRWYWRKMHETQINNNSLWALKEKNTLIHEKKRMPGCVSVFNSLIFAIIQTHSDRDSAVRHRIQPVNI